MENGGVEEEVDEEEDERKTAENRSLHRKGEELEVRKTASTWRCTEAGVTERMA